MDVIWLRFILIVFVVVLGVVGWFALPENFLDENILLASADLRGTIFEGNVPGRWSGPGGPAGGYSKMI